MIRLFSYEALETPGAPNIVARVAATDDGRARIEERLGSARRQVREMLERHRPVVEALRDALLERHELVGDEILDVIGAATASLPGSPV